MFSSQLISLNRYPFYLFSVHFIYLFIHLFYFFTFILFCFLFFPFSQNYRVNVASAVNILSSTSTSFGGGAGQIDEKLQQQLLEEEEHAMKQFKVKNVQIMSI